MFALVLSAVLSGGPVITYTAPAYDVHTQLPCDAGKADPQEEEFVSVAHEQEEKAAATRQIEAIKVKRGLFGRVKSITTVVDESGNSETCSGGNCSAGGSCSSGQCGMSGRSSGACGTSSMHSIEVGAGGYSGGCSSGSCGSSGMGRRAMRRSMRGGGCGAGGCN